MKLITYLVVFQFSITLSVNAQWPMHHHDSKGTNSTNYYGPSDGYVAWGKKNFGEVILSPVIDNGQIYISNGEEFFCYDTNGDVLWSYPIHTSFASTSYPAIGQNGTVYIGCTEDNLLYAINPDSTLKWTFQTESYPQTPVIQNNKIYITDWENIYSINENGNLNWSAEYGGRNSIPVVDNENNVYVSTGNRINAFSDQGELTWYYSEYPYEICTSPTLYNNKLFFAQKEKITVLDLDGNLLWKNTIDGSKILSALCIDNGFIYLTTANDILYKIEAIQGGDIIWSYYVGNVPDQSTPIIDNTGTVYYLRNGDFGDYYSSKLFAIMPSGELKWQLNLAISNTNNDYNYKYGTPIIGSDNAIYCYTRNGVLYKITEENEIQVQLEGSPWPMTFNNPQLTSKSQLNGPETAKLDWTYECGDNDIGHIVLGPSGDIFFSVDSRLRSIDANGELNWYGAYGSDDALLITNDSTIFGVVQNDNYRDALIMYNTIGDYLGWGGHNYWGWDSKISGLNINNNRSQILYSFQSGGGRLSCMYPLNSIGWLTRFDESESSAPVIDHDGRFLCVTKSKQLVRYLSNGEILDNKEIDFDVDGDYLIVTPPMIDINNNSYFVISSYDMDTSVIFSYNESGILKWKCSIENDFAKDGIPLTLYRDSSVIFQSAKDNLYMIDSIGTICWSINENNYWEFNFTAPIVDQSNNIFYAANEFVRSVSSEGQINWEIDAIFDVDVGPILSFDKQLLVGAGHYLHSITPCKDLIIVNQPEDSEVCLGDNFNLTINAHGSEPIEYQWYGPNGYISGANSAIMEITNIDFSDEGEYYCLLSNPCGSLESENCYIDVIQVDVDEIIGPDEVFAGDTSIYSVVGPSTSSFNWEVNTKGEIINGANSQVVWVKWIEQGDGRLGVVETNEIGCESEMTIIDVLIKPTAIFDAFFNPSVVYNSNNQTILINANSTDSEALLLLFTLNGKLLQEHSIKLTPQKATVTKLLDLPKGILIGFLKYNGSIQSIKINNF
ncbi:MAG: PQQ-binding-like beta-propeller repeat protein [Bacteroidetes bacterium]|nr:PQQ-binding-like beta-propeller repeat protein [Bacteroidota bacterium]